MKPRERKPQAQSSRMFLHNRDHRDAIYNDIYHNAMWANTENIDDELVWVKYPNNGLLVSSDYRRIGWIDIDRQFSYGVGASHGSNWMSQMIQLDDITVVWQYLSASTNYILVTEDGVVWQHIPWRGGTVVKGDTFNAYKFGYDNTIVTVYPDDYWHGGGDRKHVETWHFVKDDDTEKWSIEYNQAIITEPTINWGTELRYLGCVEDGCIIGKDVVSGSGSGLRWQFFTYELHADGTTILLSDPVPSLDMHPHFGSAGKIRVCQQGSRLFYSTILCYRFDNQQHYNQCMACMSMDGGATWNETILFGYRYYADYGTNDRLDMCVRDDRVMVIFGQYTNKEGSGAGSLHIYDTLTGTAWDEVPLPTWVDVPLLTEPSGQGVTPASQETLRIAVRPQETSDYDTTFFNMIPANQRGNVMNNGAGNVLYQKGKFDENKEFYLNFGFGNGYHAFFDNRYLAENARSFAWIDTGYNSQMPEYEQADYVMNGDYCVPYESQTFDPYQYPFWDYYKWVSADSEYVKVPRVTLSSYANWHVIVVEYLPTVGANSVLYKVPRYNV